MPRTRKVASTTLVSSMPILHVPTGWKQVHSDWRTNVSSAGDACTVDPGFSSCALYASKGPLPTISLAILIPRSSV
jgi:hypothetical protein